ncbi:MULTISPECIES: TetR/AcrR family transcriptional regulator [Thalassospira]|jgi:AcrR family transcriptional regulator|uniref:TetR/AcrR family transcriptional regulator n=1 Tax=Thalassospira povalilytica TaxID=732237 RepID=A0A8I1M9T2_9PROT|nr:MULTISPECIES: TetR/AcrR family transcriptional regulator [Thalassospira]MBN8197912.1 TetR/AcrR family transcriptional regulator [Thalassospira povalilytica]MBO6771833.1 TetR/AcrR family transcriptional regulator [Thalassospira sp.]URK19570.1 TetR/AcrR family transcriptional regulator [Thalassospira sp. GO-4]HAY49207.1 TetR family transcriptional regulator [Thalassospira sp.]|tara:strand:+ start:1267 stop:1890 length:624 start_codon:yes stop_codon:yes gene_type:complete
MSGLRAQKKADKNRRILEAATTLFRKVGYDSARIEDIAEMAGVSVGTFYNYYKNKGDMLMATVSMEVEEVLAAGEGIIAKKHDQVASALFDLIGKYYDHSLTYLSKEMWRTAMSLSIAQPETPFSKRYTALDHRLSKQVCDLFRSLQDRGIVRKDVDCTALGELVFNNVNMMFIEFVKDEEMDVDGLKASVAKQNLPVASLISVGAD